MADWSTGLFGCFSDCKICLFSYFLPCYQAARNAQYYEGEEQFITLCLLGFFCNCPFEVLTRHKLRLEKGIAGTMAMDLVYTAVCYLCVIAQDGRELKAMGFAPAGHGAMARQ